VNREDVLWLGRDLYLLPQLGDVVVDRTGNGIIGKPPDGIEQFLTAYGASAVANQVPQQFKLPGRELQGFVSASSGMTIKIDLDIALKELQRPPSKRFQKEMRRSERALGRKDLAESAEHLLRAADLEPARVEAHARLGVVLLQMKNYKEALSAF